VCILGKFLAKFGLALRLTIYGVAALSVMNIIIPTTNMVGFNLTSLTDMR